MHNLSGLFLRPEYRDPVFSEKRFDMINTELSIVTPVYNEEAVLGDFFKELTATLNRLGMSYEIIFVDDGSTDRSWEIISEFGSLNSNVRGIRFTRNFGQQVALSAGLDLSRGRAVICMDSDLQHPPALIPEMIDFWKNGFMVVNTVREDQKIPFLKKWGTDIFYRIMCFLSDTPVLASSPDFRCMDRTVVDAFRTLRERDRFIRGLISWLGFPSTTLCFTAPVQTCKKSRYTMKKMINLAVDALTSFTAFPLRFAFYLGIVVSLSSAVYTLYSLFVKLFLGTAVQGWTSLIIVLLFLGGGQMIFLGIIGEYIYRIYNEMKQRPLYISRNRLNCENDTAEKTLTSADYQSF